jgi:hypothetical protein
MQEHTKVFAINIFYIFILNYTKAKLDHVHLFK